MLVFKGNMGAETTADFGAVVGKVVSIHDWTITNLGARAAYSINKNGQVGGCGVGNTFIGNAFLWSSLSGLQDLGTPDGLDAGGCALSVNDSGQIAAIGDAGGLPYMYYWSGSSSQVLLNQAGVGVHVSGGILTNEVGINNSGQFVGTRKDPETDAPRAFIWTGGTTYQDLPPPACNVIGTAALGINNLGQVVGYSAACPFTETFHASLWSGGGLQDLGTLAGWDSSVAQAISDSGQIVGFSYNFRSNPTGGSRAFLWSGGMRDLGVLSGRNNSAAFGVNNNGQVVGDSFTIFEGGDSKAFLWSSGSGMQDLSALPGVLAAGWSVLSSARGINDAGQIVGWGTINGQQRAFLLTPSRRPFP